MLPTGQTPKSRTMSSESPMQPDPSVVLGPSTTHSSQVTFDNSRSEEKSV